MPSTLIIGLDNGTQGTKCLVYDPERRGILAQAYAPHELITGAHGRREQEPQGWIEAAERTLRACLSAEGVDPRRVAAIGVSGQQHGCVPLDADGKPLRPAKLWCDTETVAECGLIIERAGGHQAVMAAIGNRLAVGFTASKVLWLQRNAPELYARLAHILLPHEYLNFWLTGHYRAEAGDASGTAYFDIRRRCWSTELLRAIDPRRDLSACLPELIAPDAPHGRLRPKLAQSLGLSPEVLVSSGGGDNMMAAIGTGNVTPGVVTVSLGTSGTVFAYSDQPVVDADDEVSAFCSSSGGWLPLVCTMNVTVATETIRRLLNLSLREFDAAAEEAPRGAGGLLLLPFFNGERTPPWPRASALFAGMTTENCERRNVCRAAMEGATLGLRYGLEAMQRQGVRPKEIRLVGGGAKSPLWRQLSAEIFGMPVVCPVVAEAPAMGAVIQAIWCLERHRGETVGIEALCERHVSLDDASRVVPDKKAVVCYNEVFAGYLQLQQHCGAWMESRSAR